MDVLADKRDRFLVPMASATAYFRLAVCCAAVVVCACQESWGALILEAPKAGFGEPTATAGPGSSSSSPVVPGPIATDRLMDGCLELGGFEPAGTTSSSSAAGWGAGGGMVALLPPVAAVLGDGAAVSWLFADRWQFIPPCQPDALLDPPRPLCLARLLHVRRNESIDGKA